MSPPPTALPPQTTPQTTPTQPAPGAAQPPSQAAPAQQAPTQTQVVPVPFPVQFNTPTSPGSALLGALLLVIAAVVLRMLWRLPQILEARGSEIIAQFGGSYAVQNHLLRACGYLSVVTGLFGGNILGGLVAALLIMIAVNVRYAGAAPDAGTSY